MEKDKLRIDKYLWAIRVFKTRAIATQACTENKVKFLGHPVKPSKKVVVGDVYDIKTPDRHWQIEVTGLLHQRKQFSEAINFYIDLTKDEKKMSNKNTSTYYTGKRMNKIGRPTKKKRRDLDDLFRKLLDNN